MDRSRNAILLLGRVLISVLFVWGGYAKLTAPTASLQMMVQEGAPLPIVALIAAIVIELGGGLLVLLGLFTRPAAVVLGLWCVASAIVAHFNWADIDMLIHFWKNVAMAGGFAYIAAIGAGAVSLDGLRARRSTQAAG
jgi:putative oxidoreductase